MRKRFVVLLGFLVVLSCCSAGCASLYMEEPLGEVIKIESADGYSWTGYATVTNLNDFAVEADVYWTLSDEYGNTVGEGYSRINNIPAMSTKSTQVTIRANHYVDYAYMGAIVEFNMK